MKRNLIKGMILISAVALSSCSVNKMASNQNGDDVYFSKATAAEQPDYIAQERQYQQQQQQVDNNTNDDDDYYYYDDYASRINRFGYYSPFNYYDVGYSPWGFGYNSGFGLGFGYGGYGYGYSPFGYYGGLGLGFGLGYGYGYGNYYPYSYWGTGYGGGYGYGGIGYGGSGYWGPVSAYNSPRPYRGNGSPGSTIGVPRVAYNGGSTRVATMGTSGYYSGRPARVSPGAYTGDRPGVSYNGGSRGVRNGSPQYQPRPQSTNVERPAPSYSPAPSMSRGSSGGGSSSGGGGGRPARP